MPWPPSLLDAMTRNLGQECSVMFVILLVALFVPDSSSDCEADPITDLFCRGCFSVWIIHNIETIFIIFALHPPQRPKNVVCSAGVTGRCTPWI